MGSQDQTSASYGGFNRILFNKTIPSMLKEFLQKILKLNDNLVLIYTGINRTAHKIANQYVSKLTTVKKEHISKILNYVKEGERILKHGNIDDFGRL